MVSFAGVDMTNFLNCEEPHAGDDFSHEQRVNFLYV